MTTEGNSNSGRRLAFYSGIAALLAFIACNGLILATALLAVFGIALNINPHVQAVLICLFAILTSVLIFQGFRRHHEKGPLILACTGALVIILTLYIHYDKLIESIGLLALVAAAVWNWHISRRQASNA
jgi:uncharacterized membrane protein HdeD (DUF308 family)